MHGFAKHDDQFPEKCKSVTGNGVGWGGRVAELSNREASICLFPHKQQVV